MNGPLDAPSVDLRTCAAVAHVSFLRALFPIVRQACEIEMAEFRRPGQDAPKFGSRVQRIAQTRRGLDWPQGLDGNARTTAFQELVIGDGRAAEGGEGVKIAGCDLAIFRLKDLAKRCAALEVRISPTAATLAILRIA